MSTKRARSLTAVLLTCAVALAVLPSMPAQADGGPAVPAQTAPDPNARITFFVGLPFDDAGLAKQARDVSDPGSPEFRRFLTPAQIAAQYGATTKAEQALSSAAKSLGLSSAIDATRQFARVTGTLATWEKLLGLKVEFVNAATSQFFGQAANDSYTFSTQPQAPVDVVGGIPVPSAAGLSRPSYPEAPKALAKAITWFLPAYSRYIPQVDIQAAEQGSASRSKHGIDDFAYIDNGDTPLTPAPVNTGTPLGTSCVASNGVPVQGFAGPVGQEAFFTPDQVSQAYGLGGLQHHYGAKADVTVISLNGGFQYSDMQNSANCFGFHAPAIDITLGTGVGHQFVNVDPETSLDLQTVAWTLKNAKAIRLVQVTNSPTAYLDGYSTALNDPKGPPAAITLSYGECDAAAFGTPGSKAPEALFQTAALAGTSVFVATGDLGSSMCQVGTYFSVVGIAASIIEHVGQDNLPAATVDYLKALVQATLPARALPTGTVGYPASSAWVTAVGATQLTLGKNNAIVGQAVWNDLQYFGSFGNLVSTGGSSANVAAPWWQSPITGSDRRIVPDVSTLGAASPGMVMSVDGAFTVVAGTSQASPMVASAMAMVSRARGQRLGFVNPWLYRLGKSQKSAFLDVARGDNQYPAPLNPSTSNVPACCQAVSGFDAATGLGAPNFTILAGGDRRP